MNHAAFAGWDMVLGYMRQGSRSGIFLHACYVKVALVCWASVWANVERSLFLHVVFALSMNNFNIPLRQVLFTCLYVVTDSELWV